MKRAASLGLVLIGFSAAAQLSPSTSPSFPLASGQAPPYEVTERGPHQKTWSRALPLVDAWGRTRYQTNSYTELATGLCVTNPVTGELADSSPDFEITPDGFGLIRGCQHQLIVAPSVLHPAGVLDCLMPEGGRLRTALLGLNLYSPVTGSSLQIAAVKDCAGVQVAPNEILFDDVFDGMLRGGLRIRNERGEVHHDVLLAERFSGAQLERLAALGFDSRMRLEVWTEVLEAPVASVSTALVRSQPEPVRHAMFEPDTYDASVNFGTMSLLPGFGFVEGNPGASVPVFKQWYQAQPEGRTVLIEGANYSELAPLMQALPESTMTVLKSEPTSGRVFAAWPRPVSTNSAVRVAQLQPGAMRRAEPHLVWDFTLGNVTLTNYTCRSDDTVYVSGTARIAGTLVIEGGSCIKYTNATASIIIGGTGGDRGYYSEKNPSLCSFNHLPFGAVGEWVWKVVGGINPDSENPGFANVVIKAQPGGGITNSLAWFKSIHGSITACWTNDMGAEVYVLGVTVPANATATVFMPTTNNPSGFTENALGTVYGASSAPGVLDHYATGVPGWTNGATVFRVGSGTYQFAITNVTLQ